MSAAALLDALEAAETFGERAAANPLAWLRWTKPQLEWLSMPASRKLLRAGNQVGKTTAAMAEVIWRATGTHPHYWTRPPPVEIWVVCTSWSQSVAIMKKFWELCPKELLRKGTTFDPKHGFGRDSPTVVFQCSSVLRFRTTNQGPESLAGATVDYVQVDEPTDPDIWRELDKRVMRRAGAIGITLTPINRPCEWLHDMVSAGIVSEVHARLTVENLTPVGGKRPLTLLDGTPMDQAWIDEQRRKTPASWAPVVLDGEWETRPEGVWYSCFDRAKHVSDKVRLTPTRGAIHYALGIDYAAGDRPYGHVAVLAQVQAYQTDKQRQREAIYVLDEVALGGTATNEEFAREVVAMLDRNGLRWSGLRYVHGDNPVESRWIQKSNFRTMGAIARELQVAQNALVPRILNAKEHQRSAGSFDTGNQYVYARLAAGDMLIHPRCSELVRALETWDYTRMHPGKDIIDALRYALKPWVFPSGAQKNVAVRLY